MKIKILYEDKDILAIDKPSGILVHPVPEQARYGTCPDKDKTILDIFIKKYPKLEIVHRLDFETSGVMLLAKNKKAHEFLKDQFKNREVKKTYVAIVNGFVKNDHGIINKPIGRSPADFRRRLAGRGARGVMREAITEYKILKRFTSPQPLSEGEGEKLTYLELKPKTGRTHQIRVHLKFLNYPIVGDSLYNPNGVCPKGISRLALHAKSIEFKNLKGEIIKVESKIPKEFQDVIK
jgi:23S rRNA pseudouridine1911/1915/1917 synthase